MLPHKIRFRDAISIEQNNVIACSGGNPSVARTTCRKTDIGVPDMLDAQPGPNRCRSQRIPVEFSGAIIRNDNFEVLVVL